MVAAVEEVVRRFFPFLPFHLPERDSTARRKTQEERAVNRATANG